jgi:hypothetical protein
MVLTESTAHQVRKSLFGRANLKHHCDINDVFVSSTQWILLEKLCVFEKMPDRRIDGLGKVMIYSRNWRISSVCARRMVSSITVALFQASDPAT